MRKVLIIAVLAAAGILLGVSLLLFVGWLVWAEE